MPLLATKGTAAARAFGLTFKPGRVALLVTISSNSTQYNLNTSIPGYSPGVTDINFVVNSGVYLYSTSTATPALTIGGFTTGDTVTVTNNGFIIGMGGAGGTDPNGLTISNGGPGGVALAVSYPVSVRNNSTIAGGGGGGGNGSGVTSQYGDTRGAGAGGGGGRTGLANSPGGAQGFASGYPVGTAGSPGTLSAPGAGGIGGESGGVVGYTGNGGAGGDWGASGFAGATTAYTNPQQNGAGGAGGAAVSGNSNVTWLATGTRFGALV